MMLRRLYSILEAASLAASLVFVSVSCAEAQTLLDDRAALRDRISQSRIRQAFTISHGITGEPISGLHSTPNGVAKQARSAFLKAKTQGEVESVAEWCRDNFAAFSFKERDQLMVHAWSLLGDNKRDEANADLSRVNQIEEMDKRLANIHCHPDTSAPDEQDSKDIVDGKGEYTNRGLAIATIAGAQVAEMKCGERGWITAAIQKFDRMGLHVDVNDKEDYSNIVLFASDISKKAETVGMSKWCKDTAPQIAKLIEAQ